MKIPLIRLFSLSLALLAAGCGGGGGGSVSVGTDEPATVSILLTDAPVGRWDEAIATVTSVKLIGEAGQVTLFQGEETLDLLKLGDFSELFAVSDEVPAGSYSKIRLQVSRLVLRDLDDSGALVEEQVAQLAGNGKIDLNPRSAFRLEPGAVVFIELDFDMEKSLKITETGSGKLIIRPVIFVNVRTAPRPDSRLVRVYGEITGVEPVSGDIRLCQTRLASAWDDAQVTPPGATPLPPRCLSVSTDADTGIFADDGLPQEFEDLAAGEKATVIGRLRARNADDPDFGENDFPLVLDGYVIEEGPFGSYRRIRGLVTSAVDGADRFGLDIAPGQGLVGETPMPVQLYEKSRIFNRLGAELGRDAISAGRAALVDGVLVIGDEDLIRSPLVMLRAAALPGAVTVKGTLLQVAPPALTVSTATADRCVTAAGADVFLIDDSNGFSSTRGDLTDLAAGQSVVIFGTEGIDGCVIAEVILAEQD